MHLGQGSTWDERWTASDKLSRDAELGTIVGGTFSDTLSRGIQLGLKVHVHLTVCRLTIACTSRQGGMLFADSSCLALLEGAG